ncbi:cytidine and deoxycytidylate deaminase zinc-binding region domain-containing protein [Phthorimaea operculella]|nr:cytidine and deoxycytidylate deaminase zinc-binding region domain-containing protein [Phthorimaea operculella]
MSGTQDFLVVDFEELDDIAKDLIKQATEIRKRAYCPYSNFQVGAAILTEVDSRVYTGCNVENATHTPCICAERAAIPKAVCDGYLNIERVAVVAQQEEFTAPCGVCRQVLNEFRSTKGDIDVYLSKPAMDKVLCTKLSKLLPLSFTLLPNSK